mmetsp:Transcript_12988/g.46107  ORF Transcript_12988/g.46107 Transcript_12988/m.46107 type:complete len:142 (+) Transcript_12988:29-454(+)
MQHGGEPGVHERVLVLSLTLAAHSGRFFARLTQVELESAREDVTIFAAMRPTPVTLVSILEIVEPRQLAKFLHTEVPIRYAERIRLIEDGIPEWKEVPDIRESAARAKSGCLHRGCPRGHLGAEDRSGNDGAGARCSPPET